MGEDHDVGYGKPPTSGQFQKGRSGNPKGRPPNQNDAPIDIVNLLDGHVKVRDKGIEKTMPAFEVMLRRLAKKAIKQDMRSIEAFLQACEKYGLLESELPKLGGVVVAPKGLTPQEWVNGTSLDAAEPDVSDGSQQANTNRSVGHQQGDPK
jgi:hypothetical protein